VAGTTQNQQKKLTLKKVFGMELVTHDHYEV